jgi:NitT/TauT family transport system substrate-binding protein
MQNRRHFVGGLSAATAAALIGAPTSLHAEPPPETTTVRLPKFFRSVCLAPKNIAGELLRAEGFTDVRYIETPLDADTFALLSNGQLDFEQDFAPLQVSAIDAGLRIKVLAGVHSGCLELIATDAIRDITDLKGKRVGVFSMSSFPHILVTLMAAYVGLDPATDIEWVEGGDTSTVDLFNDGKIDAFLGAPPEPQEQRARGFGHSVLNTTVDRPWSQHFCCMLCGSADYVERYPVATKRVVRAILKAADICASDPELAAQLSVDGKFTDRYDHALQALREARYDRWRDFDPEDTLRFYALRMNEVGFIKSGPNKIVAEGTDFRFLEDLKRELKG